MTTWNIWTATTQFNRHYSGLLQFSPRDGATVLPDLAIAWQFSSDFSSVTLKLRPDVRWHDGKPLTVEDIIFTLDRWRNPPKGVPQPRAAGFRSITAVEKLDASTVKITIKDPTSEFIRDLADPWHIILPKHVVEPTVTINGPEQIIGTGPFKVLKALEGGFVWSGRNPDYFVRAPDGKPYPLLDMITSIAFADDESTNAAFRTRQIDLCGPCNAEKSFATKKDLKDKVVLDKMLSPGIVYLSLQGERPPFSEFKARKGLYLMIDRHQLVDILSVPGLDDYRVVSFYGTGDPFLNDVVKYPGYNPDTRKQDVAEGKRLLQEVGLKGFDLLVGIDDAQDRVIMQVLQQQLDELGVKVNIVGKETNVADEEARQGTYTVWLDGRAVNYASAVAFITFFYLPGAGAFHHGAPPPEKYMELYRRLIRTLPDAPEYNPIVKEMDRVMREEWIPKVPLVRFDEFKLSYPYVRNVDPIPAYKFIQTRFLDAWLDETAPSR